MESNRAVSSSDNVPWSRHILTRSDRWSEQRKKTFIAFGSTVIRSDLTSSRTVSKRCANRTSASSPNAPAPPFMEWTARKTTLIVSESLSPSSKACKPSCKASSSSSHSIKKDALISAIGSFVSDICSSLPSNHLESFDELFWIEWLYYPTCCARVSGTCF